MISLPRLIYGFLLFYHAILFIRSFFLPMSEDRSMLLMAFVP